MSLYFVEFGAGKMALCLVKQHAVKTYGKNQDIAPRIFNY
jgi:hypothetical protein